MAVSVRVRYNSFFPASFQTTGTHIAYLPLCWFVIYDATYDAERTEILYQKYRFYTNNVVCQVIFWYVGKVLGDV